MQRGDGAAATAAFREALEAKLSVHPARDARIGMAMYDLAAALRVDHRPEEAAELLTEVVAIYQDALKPDDPEIPIVMNSE